MQTILNLKDGARVFNTPADRMLTAIMMYCVTKGIDMITAKDTENAQVLVSIDIGDKSFNALKAYFTDIYGIDIVKSDQVESTSFGGGGEVLDYESRGIASVDDEIGAEYVNLVQIALDAKDNVKAFIKSYGLKGLDGKLLGCGFYVKTVKGQKAK